MLFTIIVIYYIPYVWYYFVVSPQYCVWSHYFVGITTISCLWAFFCLYDHNIVLWPLFCWYHHNIVFVAIILLVSPQYRVCGHFLFVWPQYGVCGHYFVGMTTISCLWPLFCLYDHKIVLWMTTISCLWAFFVCMTTILCLWPLFCFYDHNIVFVTIILIIWSFVTGAYECVCDRVYVCKGVCVCMSSACMVYRFP